jgi:hypothetical protein
MSVVYIVIYIRSTSSFHSTQVLRGILQSYNAKEVLTSKTSAALGEDNMQALDRVGQRQSLLQASFLSSFLPSFLPFLPLRILPSFL